MLEELCRRRSRLFFLLVIRCNDKFQTISVGFQLCFARLCGWESDAVAWREEHLIGLSRTRLSLQSKFQLPLHLLLVCAVDTIAIHSFFLLFCHLCSLLRQGTIRHLNVDRTRFKTWKARPRCKLNHALVDWGQGRSLIDTTAPCRIAFNLLLILI